jgi:hypothetical protein
VLLLGFAGIGVALAVWAYGLIRDRLREEEHGQAATAVPKYNCQFVIPGLPWIHDDALRSRLHVNLVLSRHTPSSHVALFFRDYETRLPSENELIDQAHRKLEPYVRGLEWEPKPKSDTARLGGLPAVVVEFVGTDPDQVPIHGECYAAAYRGYAYWFFTWGPDDNKDALAEEWPALRAGFGLLGGREGWRPRPREFETLLGKKARYRLKYAKDMWKRGPADGFDPLVEAALEADEPDPGSKRHESKAAHFFVIVLPKAETLPAAVTAARAHLSERLKEEGHDRPLLSTVKDKGGAEEDRDTNLGALPGHLTRLQVTQEDSDSYNRFMVLAVAPLADGVLVLLGDCDWGRRAFWDKEFLPLLESLSLP